MTATPWLPKFRVRAFDDAVSIARSRQGWAARTDQARRLIDGPQVAPENGLRWLAEKLVRRVHEKRDAVIVVTGEEGDGKSLLCWGVTEECNKLTGNRWAPSDLCYSAEDVVEVYDAMRRGVKPKATVVDYDEGSEGLLAGDTFDPAQVVLVRTLFRARKVGAILIISIPDIFALAKKVRGRRATVWLDIEKRGTDDEPGPTVAGVFERERRRHFRPTVVLGLSESPRCPRLEFTPPPLDTPSWVAWEKRKDEDLGRFFDEARSILKKRRERMAGRAVVPKRGIKRGRPVRQPSDHEREREEPAS